MINDRNPHAEYKTLLQTRRSEVDRLTRLHIRIGNLRLVVATVFLFLAWHGFIRKSISPLWPLVPVLIFVVLVVFHDRVIRRMKRATRGVAFYERGLARLEHRWMGTGESGVRFRESNHPAADDLDLFGEASLFQLVSAARTRIGEQTLAHWLLWPTAPATVRERQGSVEELRDRLQLREDLAVLGEDLRSGVHPQALTQWAAEQAGLLSKPARIAALILPILLLVSLATWPEGGALSLTLLALEAILGLIYRRRVRHLVEGVDQAARDLALLVGVLHLFEQQRFQSPGLSRLRSQLELDGVTASHQIARLSRLVELLDSRRNLFMQVIGPPLLYTTQLAFAVEAWRRDSGPLVKEWLSAIGEMEALSSLAGYAFEHPRDPFPELVENVTYFEGIGLGHPLLPEERCVRNDVRLDEETRVLVVSGSNMSGKSTLLRTVGINTVLAMAGAPVRARHLVLCGFQVGASIRVTDSLQAGDSRFYAEIKRLRLLVDLTREAFILLFLLDELLHGTNSHDRRIGGEGIVRGLIGRGAVGLVTTHDLALARIVEQLGPQARNVHFQDHMEEGKISFDYKLYPGIVEKSNALELMRSIGLEV
ncbi:MAG: DNA mismatch repair protein MutS [Acidobacteriota bacterium]